MLRPIILIFIVASWSQTSHTFNNQSASYSPTYRLPKTLVPTFYKLVLEISPEEDTFTGSVHITFDVAEKNTSVSDIYVHVDSEFVSIESILVNDGVNYKAFMLNDLNMLEINYGEDFSGSNNSLYFKFVSKYSTEDGYGMVKSRYVDQGVEKVLITSNFKATYARRAFPCMDEPDLKANFSIEIRHPKEYIALSNNIALDGDVNFKDDLQTTMFKTTPRISTYLVSILVSKFETPISSEDEYAFKVFTRSDVTNATSKAHSYHTKILQSLDNFIEVAYSNLSDIESYHVAVPDYSDTMGGFGLFTYREVDLLDDGDKTTNKTLQNIVSTMIYKLSHQWYGGDISTIWWSDIWANEAICTYLQYIVADKVLEDFEVMNQFVVEVIQTVMRYDAFPFAVALSTSESDVNFVWDIEKKLNRISFLKGASFLHMVNYILGGEDNFKAYMQYHWKQRAHLDSDGNITLSDFAVHLDPNEIPTDLYSYYKNWVYAPGFPLLYVKIKAVAEDGTETIEVTQKRFIYPVENITRETDTVWCIPISITTEKNKNFETSVTVMFTPQIVLDFTKNPDLWVIFNLQGRFLYRVNYDEVLWRRLITSLKNETERTDIHVLNRAQMVDDIFNIARTGDVNYSLAFDLADFLAKETEYYPWYSAFNAFSYLLDRVEEADLKEDLKGYILNLMQEVISRTSMNVVYDSMSHVEEMRDVLVLDWACKLGNLDCIAYTSDKFRNYKENISRFDDYNLRGVILCNGLRYSENPLNDWMFLWDTYTTALSVHEQNDILNSLGCVENKNLLEWYLLKIVHVDSGMKRQDALLVFGSVFYSSFGLEAAMEFLETNFENIWSFYKGVHILSEMIYMVAEKLDTDDQMNWLQNVLNHELLDEYDDVRSKAITIVSVNNYWEKNYKEAIKNVLKP